jgi:hypothetical protein
MVTYRFDAMPHAVRVAIPSTYDGALFEKVTAKEKPQVTLHEQKDADAVQQNQSSVEEMQHESQELITTLLSNGHRVTVRGVATQPQKHHTYIIAGTVPHRMTGDSTPVALCVDESVIVLRHSGEHISPLLIQELREGAVIFVEGKKSKYGVIRATQVVI